MARFRNARLRARSSRGGPEEAKAGLRVILVEKYKENKELYDDMDAES